MLSAYGAPSGLDFQGEHFVLFLAEGDRPRLLHANRLNSGKR
jgi:hypothetical protein